FGISYYSTYPYSSLESRILNSFLFFFFYYHTPTEFYTLSLHDALPIYVGCEIVRITAPTVKDARNLEHIVKGLRERACNVPIVADIHFKPEAAMEAAKWVDKVRINPGNYADSKKFVIREYTDQQYAAELNRIRERFSPLVELCKMRGIAMRIGTNHGSLSDRILNRYGDTPLGMVE